MRRLFLLFRGLFQHMNALIRLPHLIGILVFIERQEFPIGIEGGLNLTKFIVAESPNKPRAGSGCLSFRNYVQGAQSSLVIPGQIKGGAEILPVHEIVPIDLKCSLQLTFGVRKVMSLHIDAAEATVKLRIVWGERKRLFERGDRFGIFLLTDLNVGSYLDLVDARGGAGLFQFRDRSIILALFDHEMQHARAYGLVLRDHGHISSIGIEGFRFFLCIETERESLESFA